MTKRKHLKFAVAQFILGGVCIGAGLVLLVMSPMGFVTIATGGFGLVAGFINLRYAHDQL